LFRERLEHIVAALNERAIEVAVLKGAHTAYAYFPDPGTRIMSDLDLLVRPNDWERARQTLAGLGFGERVDSSHPEQSAWSLPEGRAVRALDFTHAESAWSVDLHRSLERTPFVGLTTTLGTPDLATMEPWHEFAAPVRVLPQPLLLAYLALHTSSHFFGITQIRLVELGLIARQDFATHPERWESFDRLVTSTSSGRFVYPALDLVERFVPGTIDQRVLHHAAAASPGRLRRLVRRASPASAQQLHPFPGLRERFVFIQSPREALAAVAWLVWPQDGEAKWGRIGRALRRILRARLPRWSSP
jgi:hypothetical protein